jgi:hypothetical protein
VSERVVLRLALPDAVVTWLVTGPAACACARRMTSAPPEPSGMGCLARLGCLLTDRSGGDVLRERSWITGLIDLGPYARTKGLAGDGGTR